MIIYERDAVVPMGDAKLKNSLPAALSIPEGDADALLTSGDGDAALLYLYMLRHDGKLDPETAARAMGRSDRDMTMAARRLRKLGLLASEDDARPSAGPGADPPEYEARDIVRRSMEDEPFRLLVDEVQQSLGRALSRPDLNRLYAIYDDFALPAEVVLLLVQYCKDESLRRYGPGRTVGMGFIYRVAQEWFDQEIVTYEMAEHWLRLREERRSQYGELRQELGISDREFTRTERAYLDAWLGMGFDTDAISLAVERTVTNTGALKWKYADTILRAWHEKNLHTPEEIEQGKKRPGRRPAAASGTVEWDDDKALDQIRRLREKMKNGESS